jgi:hypothetical protein
MRLLLIDKKNMMTIFYDPSIILTINDTEAEPSHNRSEGTGIDQ